METSDASGDQLVCCRGCSSSDDDNEMVEFSQQYPPDSDPFPTFLHRYREIDLKRRRVSKTTYSRQVEEWKNSAAVHLLPFIQLAIRSLKIGNLVYRKRKGDSLFDEPMHWTCGRVVHIRHLDSRWVHTIFHEPVTVSLIEKYLAGQRWFTNGIELQFDPPSSITRYRVPSRWSNSADWRLFPLLNENHELTKDFIETLYEQHVVLF